MEPAEPQPLTALLLEDELLIAMELEDALQDAGFAQVVMFPAAEEALQWLSDHRPHVAVIDIKLRDGSGDEIAALLKEQAVPFIVCSALPKDAHPAVFANAPHFEKPCGSASVAKTAYALATGLEAAASPVNSDTVLPRQALDCT